MRTVRARAILLVLAVVLIWGVWRPLPRHGATLPPERTDSAHYAAVVSRVADGEPYYAALDTGLRARGYPTGSVFNWRPPTLTMGLARAPIVMWVILGLLTIGVVAGTIMLFQRSAPEVMLLALLMQIGASVGAFTPLAFVLHETWGGAFIALSALVYTRGYYRSAALLGISGLFVRELVAPYVAVCALLALWQRRKGELAIWVAGGLAWCVFFYLHAMAVKAFIQPTDLAHPSWVQFGGGRFVLATIGFGSWFYYLPPWAAAVGGVLLLASPWAPTRAPHVKAAALTYVALFFVVGQPFNQSWGLLTAPLWAIAYGLGAEGVVRLVRDAMHTGAAIKLKTSPSSARN
jgi:hypothetical protein